MVAVYFSESQNLPDCKAFSGDLTAPVYKHYMQFCNRKADGLKRIWKEDVDSEDETR
jgi:hypothetical protein